MIVNDWVGRSALSRWPLLAAGCTHLTYLAAPTPCTEIEPVIPECMYDRPGVSSG